MIPLGISQDFGWFEQCCEERNISHRTPSAAEEHNIIVINANATTTATEFAHLVD